MARKTFHWIQKQRDWCMHKPDWVNFECSKKVTPLVWFTETLAWQLPCRVLHTQEILEGNWRVHNLPGADQASLLVQKEVTINWSCRPFLARHKFRLVRIIVKSSFCFFFACGKKTYSQCEKTKNLELVLFSPFTSDTRYMCVAKK